MPENPLRIRNDFGKLAESYKRFRRDYPEGVYADLFAFCPNPDSDVLDLGCGTGIVTKHLADQYRNVVGVDISQEILNAGRPDLPENVELVQASAEELPFDDESFDLIASAAAFHWFDYDKAGAELMRVLRENGKFYTFWKGGRAKSKFYIPLFAYNNILKYIPEVPRSNKEPISKEVFKRIGFKSVEEVEFDFDDEFSEEGILGYIRSHSTFNLLPEEAQEEYMARNREDLQAEMKDGVFIYPSKMSIYKCEK